MSPTPQPLPEPDPSSLPRVKAIPADLPNGSAFTFDLRRPDVTAFNHGLHKYPAKFIPQIAQWALTFRPLSKQALVLDPFCGSGTALVEAAISGHNAIGYDINPLAVLLSSAKGVKLANGDAADAAIDQIIAAAGARASAVDSLDLHHTWDFWFNRTETARLLALRDCILEHTALEDGLTLILRSVLSSILKRCSRLSEDQIKVRVDPHKIPADPFEAFRTAAREAIRSQLEVTTALSSSGGSIDAYEATATTTHLPTSSVDRIITSPPYINAVDYTMAHKYNLFLLNLVKAKDFKSHCRQYIGMTERAVRAADIALREPSENPTIQRIVDLVLDSGSPSAANRAFVVQQYFEGMALALREMRRVLKRRGLAVIVLGATNRICGVSVPTAAAVASLAEEQGLSRDLVLHHVLANRSSMRMNRAPTGGELKTEAICVFRKG